LADNFIDFKMVKERVSMEAVLDHYRISLRRVNQNALRGTCPLPTHTSDKSNMSFAVQTTKNIWSCQSTSCAAARAGKKGGNVLDFVAHMEKCSVRDAALHLADWFSISETGTKKADTAPVTKKLVAEKEEGRGEEVNSPLAFMLKDVDVTHSYIRERGITEETATLFGAGFFPGRGSMSGRVVIPIHDERGALLAYAGRAIDDSEPKYKLPAGFRKSIELFNLNRVGERDVVIVVEGFFDCMKVTQAGYPCVALMGASMSDVQEESLARFSRVLLFLDGDDVGRATATWIAAKLTSRTFVKIVHLADGVQPDQLSSEEIHAILGSL